MARVAPPRPSVTGTDEVVILLHLQFKPGSEEHVGRRMQPAIAKTRAEDGNNEFTFFKVSGEPTSYVVLERWRDQAALDRHMEQPYTKDVLALFAEHLAFPMSELDERGAFLDELFPST